MKEDEKLAFGRRTQANIKSGKTIRTFKDGTELFDDYWTDSEGSDDTTHSEIKLNNILEKLDSGLATESNSGDVKNQGTSKNITSLSQKSVSAEDVVSSPLTGSKHTADCQKIKSPSTRHLQSKKGSVMQSGTKPKHHSVKKRLADDFTKFPENVSPHHSEKLLSNSHSDSEKSSQDVISSPLTRSKHRAYYQKINSPSLGHLQSRKGSVRQSSTKPKHHSVKKRLVDYFTKFPENVSSHHSEKSLSNSHSDSEKSSQDVVSSPLTRSKHRAYCQKINSPITRHKGSVRQSSTKSKHHSVKKHLVDDFTKFPENVSPHQTSHHSEKSLSNSHSDSEKSSQNVVSSPLTRSKHRAYYQKINSPSTRHYLQSKKGSVMQPGAKSKHHSVEKHLVDDFTKFPENVSPHQPSHHGEISLSNSHSDSEKSSQDLATSLTRSKHAIYDQQFNTPGTSHNLQSKRHTAKKLGTKYKRKTTGKYLVGNVTECPVTISTQCQTSNREQSMLTSNAEKAVQVLSVDVDHCLSDSGHNLNENPIQRTKQLSYNKEKSLDLINAEELKMHRKVKWLSKSNRNPKKSVTVTRSTAVSSKSPVQSPERFQFRKKKNTAVIRSDTEDENFDQNRVKKIHKFKSKIPVKIPASLMKGTNSYHITAKDFNSDKISENVENTEILGTVVNNEIINSHKKIEQKSMQSSLNKNLKRRKELNACRFSPRISALSNNNNMLTDDNEADELPNKKQQVIKTTKRINKNLSSRKKQQRKSYPTRYSAFYPRHLVDASVPELPSQRENLHNLKINDKYTSKNSESHCSKTERRYISRSGRVRYSPLAFWKNERIQVQFRKDGNISILGVEKCSPVNEKMKNKVKKTVSETQSVKPSSRTLEFNSEMENKDLTTIPIIDVSTGEEIRANIIRPFSSLIWDYPDDQDPDYDDFIISYSFHSSSSNWGFICIKPHRQKPPQFSPNESIYFNVIKGKVEVELHTSKFVLKKGGSFIVPRGNIYSITNVQKSKSILMFNTTPDSFMLNSYSEE